MNRVVFSAVTGKWATPVELYSVLDAEFHFTLDPCPMDYDARVLDADGLSRSWAGHRIYCNPPYGRGVEQWLARAGEAEIAVFLLPSRTDAKWFHEYALKADEIRFIRGRLRFNGARYNAPFPSLILVYRRTRAERAA